MVWIKETKKQGEVSKNKTLRSPSDGCSAGERREGAAAVRAQPETARIRGSAREARPLTSRSPRPRKTKAPSRLLQGLPRREEIGGQEGQESNRRTVGRSHSNPRALSRTHHSPATPAP
jgi:hypothetical protein